MPKRTSLSRSCGSCTACCGALAVRELEKRAHTPCLFCNEGAGCRIYERRPDGCRQFCCEWLKGFGAEEDRPDKTGVVLDFVHGELGGVFQMWEVREGSFRHPVVLRAARLALQHGIPVMVSYASGTRAAFMTPPGYRLPEKIHWSDYEEALGKIEVRPTHPAAL